MRHIILPSSSSPHLSHSPLFSFLQPSPPSPPQNHRPPRNDKYFCYSCNTNMYTMFIFCQSPFFLPFQLNISNHYDIFLTITILSLIYIPDHIKSGNEKVVCSRKKPNALLQNRKKEQYVTAKKCQFNIVILHFAVTRIFCW